MEKFKELFEAQQKIKKGALTKNELQNIHKGVKKDYQVEIINELLTNKKFQEMADEFGAYDNPSVMKNVITDILTRIKKVTRKGQEIVSIDFNFSGIPIKKKIILDDKLLEAQKTDNDIIEIKNLLNKHTMIEPKKTNFYGELATLESKYMRDTCKEFDKFQKSIINYIDSYLDIQFKKINTKSSKDEPQVGYENKSEGIKIFIGTTCNDDRISITIAK